VNDLVVHDERGTGEALRRETHVLTETTPAWTSGSIFAMTARERFACVGRSAALRRSAREPFANSIGVFSGRPEVIEIEFDAEVADYVASREWHRSQDIVVREDGSIFVTLCVTNDRPLRTWIVGFGGMARVVTPRSLAREILEEAEMTRERYMPKLRFEPLKMTAMRRGCRRRSSA
jgi:predicted DNA-binding transcriptional regulator YafY